jgi:rare lipoprotein A
MQKIIAAVGGLLLTAMPASATSMLASWYGPGFHGRTTASGQTYNQFGYTAAHKSLPFGTRLRVCYQGCVDVRINDRGPFIGPRELDLSYGAAAAIGLVDVGVGTVKVTFL